MFCDICIIYGAILTEKEVLNLVKNHGLYSEPLPEDGDEDVLYDILFECRGLYSSISKKFKGLVLMEIPHDLKDLGNSYILGTHLCLFTKERNKREESNAIFPLKKTIELEEKYMNIIKGFDLQKETYDLLTKKTELCLVPDDCCCCS